MIEIKEVTKKYGDTVILDHADYTFPQKGIVCLMGASGSGKTTLLNLLAGFDTDYEGEISVCGTNLKSLDESGLCGYRKSSVGFVFQNYHLLPGYTVLENVMIAVENPSDGAALKKAKGLLERLGIGDKEGQRVENLSGGQKQRVAIARALMDEPRILFADEPTGALDRASSNEIMKLLKEISKDRLVVVITHDAKICDFADEVIHIKEQKIVSEKDDLNEAENKSKLPGGEPMKTNPLKRGAKNFKVHLKRYAAVSLAVAVGITSFLFSLSFGNVTEKATEEFKEKNTAFNNGYIKGADDGTLLEILKSDDRIENVYYQYKIQDITLSFGGKTENMPEKYPTAKTAESLSYGIMPRRGENEIALTPSLAKKFNSDISALLGEKMVLEFDGNEYSFTVCGIYNAGYDDFFISSDAEENLYEGISRQENYSLSYDVKDFSDVVSVSEELKEKGIISQNAAAEVEALINTFESLKKLFAVVSALILAIGLFICAVLLFKLQNARCHEVGLLSALGFERGQIAYVISAENMLLSALATVMTAAFVAVCKVLGPMFGLPIIITGPQMLVSALAAFASVILISGFASAKLLKTEPAEALRK